MTTTPAESHERMAPTTHIETVNIVRPLKVMAFICGVVTILLLIVSVSSTEWLSADGYREGLWQECFWDKADGSDVRCQPNPTKAWIISCAALGIISLLVVFAAAVVTAVGLALKTPDYKFKLYRVGMYLMFFSLVCIVIALAVFPAMFMQEIRERQKSEWQFAWAYGVAWGGAIFCFGGAILLLIDKESEEIFYKEKTYYPEPKA